MTFSRHFIWGTFVVTGLRHRLCTYALKLSGWWLLLKFGRRTAGFSTWVGWMTIWLACYQEILLVSCCLVFIAMGSFANLAAILPRYTNPTPEEQLLNLKLASQRQCIEHVFGDHRACYKLFSVPHYLRLYNQGVKVQSKFLLSFLCWIAIIV